MIKQAFDDSKETKKTIDTIVQEVKQGDGPLRLTVLFISSCYDLSVIEKHLAQLDGLVMACTTSGEISQLGLKDHSISALAFYGDEFEAELITIANLNEQKLNQQQAIDFSAISSRVQARESKMGRGASSFGILLADGLSMKEEALCSYLDSSLPHIPFIGGSAGDDLKFKETFIFSNGHFVNQSATLALVTTNRKFKVFKAHHFKPTDKKVIITEIIPGERTIKEMNGMPAAQCYAQVLGVKVQDLTPAFFSKNPLMLKVANDYYIRSIQKINPDNSLTFFCAIENGLVLVIGENTSIDKSNADLVNDLKQELKEIDSCLFFECILRKLEILDLDKEEYLKINNFYKNNKCTGFYTYGEQFSSIHINQTLTGVAFAKK